jgi:hypothetical protein
MKTHIKFTLAAIILCSCVVLLYTHIFSVPKETHTPNKEFPARISDWIAEEALYDKESLNVLSPDKIIHKYHQTDDAPLVNES